MVRALILDFCEKRNVYTALICELDIRKIMDCFNGFILISKYSRIIPYSEINQKMCIRDRTSTAKTADGMKNPKCDT